MSALAALRRVRLILASGVIVRAIAWGLAAAGTLLIGAVLADIAAPLALGVREALLWIAGASGLCVAFALAVRDRAVLSARDVALWIEEREPALRFRLISAVELGDPRLARDVAPRRWPVLAMRRTGRALATPALIVAVIGALLVLLPAGAVARVRGPRAGDSLERAGVRSSGASRLEPLVALVIAPAYAHAAPRSIDNPATIRALVGSEIVLRGRGAAAGIFARIGNDSVSAASDSADRWSIAARAPVTPAAIELVDRGYEKIITSEPIHDAPPVVTLASPARDTVLRVARGRLSLAATASDDIALESVWFELIVSSGEGETFTFRSAELHKTPVHGKAFDLSGALSLDSLHLKAGDILHVRAAARDANDVSGPGVGYSETRAIRVARPGEYDSVALDAAPPTDEDKSIVSERMLIMLAEALDRQRPTLVHDSLVRESQSIAADQKRLRRTVGDVVFSRLGGSPSGEETVGADSPARARTMQELLARADSATSRAIDPTDFGGGEAPVIAVNTPLLEAYNAMWDAGGALEIGEPGRALPFMRRALAAIERARQAERVYLHGRAPQIVVDVGRARLQGKDKGSSSTRRPLTASDSAAQTRELRFARAMEMLDRARPAAIDSLLLLRIDALSSAPELAAALRDATTALRGDEARAAATALARARRALGGIPVARDSLSRWGVVP